VARRSHSVRGGALGSTAAFCSEQPGDDSSLKHVPNFDTHDRPQGSARQFVVVFLLGVVVGRFVSIVGTLLIMGAARSGTTALRKYLNEHPQAYLCTRMISPPRENYPALVDRNQCC
jgi:hypothetical protein